MAIRSMEGRLADLLERVEALERRRRRTGRSFRFRLDTEGWISIPYASGFSPHSSGGNAQYSIFQGVLRFRGTARSKTGPMTGGYHTLTTPNPILAEFYPSGIQNTETILVSSGSGGIGRGYISEDGELMVYANTGSMSYVALSSWNGILHPDLPPG